MNVKNFIFIILLGCANALLGQSFTSAVSKSTVGVREQFEVSFTLNANGGRYTPPNFSGFQLLSGPNESSSMTSINGAITQSISISYVLAAEREGSFVIGSASVTVDGKPFTTKPIRITVVKGRPQQQQNNNQQAQQGQPDDTFNENPSGDISKDIFIKAVVDKTSAYIGQQLTVSYKLYTRMAILQNDLDKAPDLNGFWSQDTKSASQSIPWKVESYKGVKYNMAEIKQTVLFPERSGNLTIDPLGMSFIVRQPVAPRNAMEQFFGGGYKEVKVKVKSTPVTIHVKPLPEAGKPASFTGAVGSFSIDAWVDKKELKANEALNYKLKITGTGNIKLLKDAVINPPADFEKYDPKIADTLAESGVSGTRILTYLLIPRHQGNYTIEPVQFSYFNPVTEKFVTLTTKAFPVKVNKGTDNGGNVVSIASANQKDVKLLNKDIRYIKTDNADLNKDGETFYGSAFYYLLLLLGPVLFAGAFAYRKWNNENNSDIVKVKSRMAGKLAARHMANAQKQLAEGNHKGFYEAVSRGLYGYLSDKLNIPAANLDRENIVAELQAKNVDNTLTEQLVNTLDLCEMARFAPVSGVSQQEVFERSKTIINDIETQI